MEDSLYWKEDGIAHWMHGFGHYHEQYVKRAGKWLFQSRRLERLHVETSSPANSERVDRSGENDRYASSGAMSASISPKRKRSLPTRP